MTVALGMLGRWNLSHWLFRCLNFSVTVQEVSPLTISSLSSLSQSAHALGEKVERSVSQLKVPGLERQGQAPAHVEWEN